VEREPRQQLESGHWSGLHAGALLKANVLLFECSA
jgi:hypothetical protein